MLCLAQAAFLLLYLGSHILLPPEVPSELNHRGAESCFALLDPVPLVTLSLHAFSLRSHAVGRFILPIFNCHLLGHLS